VSDVAPASAADDWLPELPCTLGEILLERRAEGKFTLCHRDDGQRDDLAEHRDAADAAEIARYDDDGNFRPLKTAPNLRHGWRLLLSNSPDVKEALGFFYPGRVAAFLAWRKGRLTTTSFRQTLERQTGMYRAAAKITDAQANELIGNFCRSDGGCLRTILWRRDAAGVVPSTLLPATKYDPAHDQLGRGGRGIPLLCQEICNLLVAEARTVVKAQE
jgi:sirohydrochlorin cobaltochelatase